MSNPVVSMPNKQQIDKRGELFSALGGSIAYEEYKGDYARARGFANAWLAEARQQNHADTLADALIWRSIVHLLQGEPLEGFKCLREAELLSHDADRNLLVATYKWFARLEQFNTSLDGGGISSLEITARWDGVKEATSIDDTWKYWLVHARSRKAISLASFAFKLMCNLKGARGIVDSAVHSPAQPQIPLQGFARGCVEYRASAEENREFGVAAYAAWCAADIYRRGGETTQAATLLKDARSLYERAQDPAGVALCRMTEADWRCAPSTTPLAWNFAWREDTTHATNTSFKVLPVWPDLRVVAECRAIYADAKRLFREACAPRGIAGTHLRFAYLAFVEGDAAAAIRCAEEAITGFAKCGDERGRATACVHLIMARIAAGRPTSANEFATAIGDWERQHGSLSFCLSLGFLLSEAGRHWLNQKGDFERAMAALSAAEAFHKSLGTTASAAQAVADQGFVYDAIGERPTALTLFERALDLYLEAMRSLPGVTDVVRNQVTTLVMSVFNLYLAQTDGAGMERSVARWKVLGVELFGPDPLKQLKETVNLSQDTLYAPALKDKPTALSLVPGEIGKAWPVASHDQSKQLVASMCFKAIHQAQEFTSVLSPLYKARTARDLGKGEQVEELLAKATEALPLVDASQRFFMEASILAEQKRFDEAAVTFRKHLEQNRSVRQSGPLGGTAALLLGQQERNELEMAFTTFVRLRAFADAKTHFDALRQMAGEEWWANSSRPWLSLSDCGEMYEGLKELELAVICYDKAISEIEARRSRLSRNELKTALAADKGSQYLYFQAARALSKKGDDERAFGYAERGKARALLDLMAGGIALAHLPEAGTDALRSWRQLNAQLALWRGLLAKEYGEAPPNQDRIKELNELINNDEAALDDVEVALSHSHPRFHQVIASDVKTLPIDQVAAALEPGTVLLEYLFLGEDMMAWVINHNGVAEKAIRTSVDARVLSRDIRAFHQACIEQKAIDFLGAELADLFFAPFSKVIRESSDVIIVPYGAAHALPFHALPFDGKPLSAIRAVSYLPSASTLQFLARERVAPRIDRILVVGNPTGNLPNIPAAAIEAVDVASLFHEQALIGPAATEEAVRERIVGTPLLHFATHATLSETAPLSSSINLANGDELTVYELLGLQLDADLVVLSACDTGRGEITGGDDVLGLTRGLLAAGARSSIVSLWPVEDVSTSLLMCEFYKGLISRKESPKSALARAQTWLRESTAAELRLADQYERLYQASGREDAKVFKSIRHHRANPKKKPFENPYYWAGFSFIGI